MGTVVVLHRGGAVTIRFDDGSDIRVTLKAGDAETCPDHELIAPELSAVVEATARGRSGAGRGASPSRSRGGGGGGGGGSRRPGRGRSGGNGARALGPGGRVLEAGEGVVLTENRARALLETDPNRLIGLVYQECHPGYGGWWKTTVIEISSERIGDGKVGKGKKDGVGVGADVEALWPVSVTVGQAAREEDGAEEGEGEGSQGSDSSSDGPEFTYKRKTSVLLSRLRAWDKHREASWQAAAAPAITPTRLPSGRTKTPSVKARAAAADAAIDAADDSDFDFDTAAVPKAGAKPAKRSNRPPASKPPPASEADTGGESRGRKTVVRSEPRGGPAAVAAVGADVTGTTEGCGGAKGEERPMKQVVKVRSAC